MTLISVGTVALTHKIQLESLQTESGETVWRAFILDVETYDVDPKLALDRLIEILVRADRILGGVNIQLDKETLEQIERG